MPGRKWGGVARRGAGQVNPEKRQDAQAQRGQRGRGRGRQDERRTERTERTQRTERREPKELGPPPAWEPEQWIEEPDAEVKPLRAAAGKAVARGGKGTARQSQRQPPRTADAPGELVTEGRIVAGGSLADRGDIGAAIRLLEKGPVHVKRPKAHHLRLWYALADLYERAGDTPKARELFGRIVGNEPDFADAAERLAAVD